MSGSRSSDLHDQLAEAHRDADNWRGAAYALALVVVEEADCDAGAALAYVEDVAENTGSVHWGHAAETLQRAIADHEEG